jgi:hypothetical protein
MAMPVLIGALSKDLFVLFVAPILVFQFMGGIKMLYPRQIYHFQYLSAKLGLLYGFDKKVLNCGYEAAYCIGNRS